MTQQEWIARTTDIRRAMRRRRALAEEATPGPWVHGQFYGDHKHGEPTNMGCGEVWTEHDSVFGGNIAMPSGDCYPRSGYAPKEDMAHIARYNPLKILDDIQKDEDFLDFLEADRYHWASADRYHIVEPGLQNLEARYIHG